jgi:hypothetical protein
MPATHQDWIDTLNGMSKSTDGLRVGQIWRDGKSTVDYLVESGGSHLFASERAAGAQPDVCYAVSEKQAIEIREGVRPLKEAKLGRALIRRKGLSRKPR